MDVDINDLQELILYRIVDGNMTPTWLSIRYHNTVKKAVVLFVPGLGKGLFNGSIELEPSEDPIDFSEPDNSIRRSMASEENVIGISEEIQSLLSIPQR